MSETMRNVPPGPVFASGREVRVIPKGWRHPRDARGKYWPLLPADQWPATAEALSAWMAENEASDPPARKNYMPDTDGLPPERTAIVAYETTTEGTPISPAFPNTREGRLQLTRYCAERETTFGHHTADAEAWAVILFGNGDAGVSLDGTVVANDR